MFKYFLKIFLIIIHNLNGDWGFGIGGLVCCVCSDRYVAMFPMLHTVTPNPDSPVPIVINRKKEKNRKYIIY